MIRGAICIHGVASLRPSTSASLSAVAMRISLSPDKNRESMILETPAGFAISYTVRSSGKRRIGSAGPRCLRPARRYGRESLPST